MVLAVILVLALVALGILAFVFWKAFEAAVRLGRFILRLRARP